MIVKTYPIKYKYGDVVKIKPIADVHYGCKHCDVRAFKRYMDDHDDNTYFLGIGDFYDAIIMSDFRYRRSSDATVKEGMLDELVDMGAELLEPYKDKILGLGEGNHERKITLKFGTNLVQRLCNRLGVDFLGYSGLVKLSLREDKKGRGRTVVIRYHHGWGGGSRTQGADLTKYSKDTKYWQADVFLYGHVHRKQADRVPRMGLVGETMVSKPKVLAICGTFLKTFSKGSESTYSEEGGYPPVDVGGLTINIRPDSRYFKMWVDM